MKPQTRTEFLPDELAYLRHIYSSIRTVNPAQLPRIRRLFAECGNRALAQLVDADIAFISALARNEQTRRQS